MTAEAGELAIAADYLKQRLEAMARKIGREPLRGEELSQWLRENTDIISSIAERYSEFPAEFTEATDEFLRATFEASADEAVFDPVAHTILKPLLTRIQQACREAGLEVPDDAAIGSSLEFTLQAWQAPVMMTNASMIGVSRAILLFMNVLSKLVAASLPQVFENGLYRLGFDASEMIGKIQGDPPLLESWHELMLETMVNGIAPAQLDPATSGLALKLRVQILFAFEEFVVGHEYAHHFLRHGAGIDSSGPPDPISLEFEADALARMISYRLAASNPPNIFAASGGAAVALLLALDTIERGRLVLLHGEYDGRQHYADHPATDERIAFLAEIDASLPLEPHLKALFDNVRKGMIGLFAGLWDLLEPEMHRMHADGIRPSFAL